MNTAVKLGVAAALALGYATANASVALPSSGSTDLILFVQDVTTGESYAGDTGISINTVLPSSSLLGYGGSTSVAASNFPATLPANFSVGPTANLTAFLGTTHTGDDVEWSVQAAQYPSASNVTSNTPIGNTKYITTYAGDPGDFSGLIPANLAAWGNGFNNDMIKLNTNLGSASSVYGASAASAGLWDVANSSAIVTWYSNGVDTEGVQLGGSVSLYGLTGNNGTVVPVQLYDLSDNLTLKADGTLTTGTASPVPVPAALWLFGSGVLGLAGVGRRKAVKA